MAMISVEILRRLNELSCEDVAEKLDMQVKNHRALCFMHSDHHPSLAFLGEGRKSWRCFACNKGGNAINLVCEKMSYGFVEACTWLCNQYGIYLDGERTVRQPQKMVKPLTLKRAEEKNNFSQDVTQFLLDHCKLTDIARRFLFDERKLKQDVIEKLNISSIDRPNEIVNKLSSQFDEATLMHSGLVSKANGKFHLRLFTPCLLFPYYDIEGELIGLQSRYLGTNERAPRFQFLSAQKTHLFNMPILSSMKSCDELYISEGITDCLALLSSGKKVVALPSATILPEKDLSLLAKYRLYMYPDCDKAGNLAFVNLQRYFIKQMCFLKAERLPDGFKDYSDFYKEKLWQIK